MSMYVNFALLYDDLMANAPYDKWIEFTQHFIKDKHVKQIVDLGCGTGEITVRLAKDYNSIYGVDLSTTMLSIAQQKAFENNTPHVKWIEQDIRQLSGFSNVDVFISYCDVLNYIVDLNDIERVFNHVYDSLAEGGLFIFDVHSLEHVKQNLIEHTFTYKDDELAYIWHCSSGEHEGEMHHDMTFFYRNEHNSLYERFDEVHHQRTYSVETYENLLRRANFQKINFYNDFHVDKTFSEQNSERIFIVAEK